LPISEEIDAIPIGEWSASDATDRLRVAIEKHQTAKNTAAMQDSFSKRC
jgi:hypothetical protein